LSIEDKNDEVRELIIMGKERGFLLYDEVNDLLSEGVCSSDELDSVFSLFGSAGIEVSIPNRRSRTKALKMTRGMRTTEMTEVLILVLSSWIKPMIRRVFTSEKWAPSRYSAERAKLRLPSG
jgi:hypothetical protein